ncbi:hypothetical protein HGRIS_010740 [Hohenbuehelia grisea]|uniref:Uncharacterized protein n=1 Tax=Hohenbuehelia grisea TaxID=104357 RepID=A0ABR3IXV7_9AGAR
MDAVGGVRRPEGGNFTFDPPFGPLPTGPLGNAVSAGRGATPTPKQQSLEAVILTQNRFNRRVTALESENAGLKEEIDGLRGEMIRLHEQQEEAMAAWQNKIVADLRAMRLQRLDSGGC